MEKVEGDLSMKPDEIKVDIKCNLTVDERTANGGLWIVQSYLNSHKVKLVQREKDAGEVELSYEPA